MRATASAWVSGALALAAHSGAGGGLPSAGTLTLLAILIATLAGVVAVWPRAADTRVLVGLLGVTQLLAHLLQATAGHSHHPQSQASMVAAHVVAVLLSAVLISASDRLRCALSRAIRACARLIAPAPRATRRARVVSTQPRRVSRTFLTTRSYRGPPAVA